jgi:hypothetical protein
MVCKIKNCNKPNLISIQNGGPHVALYCETHLEAIETLFCGDFQIGRDYGTIDEITDKYLNGGEEIVEALKVFVPTLVYDDVKRFLDDQIDVP